MSRMPLPLWLKILWTIWVIAWAPLYWRQYGAQNFLYFCDLGNFLIAVGLWLEGPLIFSWQAPAFCFFRLSLRRIFWAHFSPGSIGSEAQNSCSMHSCLCSCACSVCFMW